MIGVVAVVVGVAWADVPDAASLDFVGGGSDAGTWVVGASGGWPWFEARAQVGLPKGWTPVLEVESGLFRRWHPSIGLSNRLVDAARWRLSAEVLMGWQVQTGTLAQRGPSAVGRVRVLGIAGRVNPWVMLGTRHTLLFDRTRTIREAGTTTEWGARHRWSPHVSAGVVVPITPRAGFDVGIDWHLADAETTAIALPGLHVGVQLGGGR